MSNKLLVRSLGARTTEAELNDLFAQVGTVLSVLIPVDHQTGVTKNYAFINMETVELAQAAVLSLNGHTLHGRKLQVTELRDVERIAIGEGLRYERRGWGGARK